MSVLTAGVPFAVMAKRNAASATTTSDKEPVSLKVAGELLDRARDFIRNQPAPPTLTAIFESALREWLDRHHPKPKK